MKTANTEYTIKTTMYSDQRGGKQAGFGIAEFRIGHQGIYILCSEKSKRDGALLWPYKYYITREKALTYPKKQTNGPKVLVIPIEDCEVHNR